jgi:hypothetical protein
MIYGDPGSIFPLNIRPAGDGDHFTLSIPAGLLAARRITYQASQPFGMHWTFLAATGTALSTSAAAPTPIGLTTIAAAGAATGFAGGVLTLKGGSYLRSAPIPLDFKGGAKSESAETPPRMRLSFRGTAPWNLVGGVLLELQAWNIGGISFGGHWDSGHLAVTLMRGDQSESFMSTRGRTNGVEQLLEVEWIDNPGGPGGMIGFFIDGLPAGGPFRTKIKPRIPSGVQLFTNASLDNTRNAVDGLKVREVRMGYDAPVEKARYTPVASGPVDRATLAALVIDARAVGNPQPPMTLSYADAIGTVATVDVTIGPLAVPAGQAYKAVLVDWSSGVGVPHPDVLVMTRIAAQNCRFEDDALGGQPPPWIECLPQGPVPNIAGINYYCEAIRAGDYVQFQFGYDWDHIQMPANPFGDPTGKHSYMVPHKWLIYDIADRLLATIETPDGKPLNDANTPRLFSGQFDGRGCAITTKSDQWYPHGTVRSGIIWRSADPGAYDRTAVAAAIPLFDLSIPFASHLDFSVNGFDLRVFAGGAGNDGQANGFGNSRVMSWEPTTYARMTAKAGDTADRYQASLYSQNSMAANAAIWLKYTPFNMQGRSPITGPGGVRDDRQIIAEMVANYIHAPGQGRPHDGRSYREISLNYLTGYVSDAVHCFEQGRNTPLFKGNARRPIVMRNHYYGPGNLNIPPSQAYYAQGGRLSDWTSGTNPLRVVTPAAGDAPDAPYFGTCQIDKAHAHQFPGWGSLLFRTPEFAFLGHKFWDQNRLYSNDIIGDGYGLLWSIRDGAWAFLHAALAWKTASASSTRLYSRAEVMDFAVADFEYFHDHFYATTPGYRDPPVNLFKDGAYDERYAAFAAAARFGTVVQAGGTISQLDFQIGYWLTALGAGEKMGFNDALRRASAKAGEVLDWLIAMQRKRIVGRLLHAPNILAEGGYIYVVNIWSAAQIEATRGDVSRLPQTYEALAAFKGTSPGWDVYMADGQEQSRDGPGMDLLIAGPSILRYLLRQTGEDIEAAQAVANGWRNARKQSELGKGADAGTGWFRYLVACHNPARSAQG